MQSFEDTSISGHIQQLQNYMKLHNYLSKSETVRIVIELIGELCFAEKRRKKDRRNKHKSCKLTGLQIAMSITGTSLKDNKINKYKPQYTVYKG